MKDKIPFFSVIIPTYNRAALLSDCLSSLTNSTYPRDQFEVIIVDDGGTESLEPVVTRFQQRLSIKLVTQPNQGPAAARNTGARIAAGNYFAFTDDDCEPASDWLDRLAYRIRISEPRIVGGKTINKLVTNPYSVTSQLIVDVVYAHYNETADNALFFASNNFAVPAAQFHALGGFESSFICSEDRELCDRWLHNGFRMTYEPNAIVYHGHRLSLGKFCRQHFGYGRGAYRYHSLRARRGSGQFSVERRFYGNLLRLLGKDIYHQPLTMVPVIITLLFVWQWANSIGCFAEFLRAWIQTPARQ